MLYYLIFGVIIVLLKPQIGFIHLFILPKMLFKKNAACICIEPLIQCFIEPPCAAVVAVWSSY